MRLTSLTCLAPLFVIGVGCQQGTRAAAPVILEIVVEADPGVRLSTVPIRVDGELFGHTSADGTLRVPIIGPPGRVLRVDHECPADHRASPEGASIRLRRYERGGPAPIQVSLACRPLVRIAAFVVRAKNGPALPIRVNGELVATTNSSGVAHFSMSGPVGTEFLVELDAIGHPTLLPRSAATLVRLPDANEVFVIAPSFQSADGARKQRQRRPRIIKIE